jgi:hypothetical protein
MTRHPDHGPEPLRLTEDPPGLAIVRASKGRRGARLPFHLAPIVEPYGFPDRRALCGSEPSSGFYGAHASPDSPLDVCDRCAVRFRRMPAAPSG